MCIGTHCFALPCGKPEGERRGLVIVNNGDSKGKSKAAFGLGHLQDIHFFMASVFARS